MSKTEAILLDMDGVLTDPRETVYASILCALDNISKSQKFKVTRPSMEEVVELFGNHISSIFANFLECRKGDRLVELATSAYHENYPRFIHLTKPMPRAHEALRMFKPKFELAVVTNTPTKLTKMVLEHLGLLSFFKAVAGCDKGDDPKPDPHLIYEASKILGLEPNLCMFIGDSIQDARAAKSAGIPFVGIRTWVYSEEDLKGEGALAVFDDLMSAAVFARSFAQRS